MCRIYGSCIAEISDNTHTLPIALQLWVVVFQSGSFISVFLFIVWVGLFVS